ARESPPPWLWAATGPPPAGAADGAVTVTVKAVARKAPSGTSSDWRCPPSGATSAVPCPGSPTPKGPIRIASEPEKGSGSARPVPATSKPLAIATAPIALRSRRIPPVPLIPPPLGAEGGPSGLGWRRSGRGVGFELLRERLCRALPRRPGRRVAQRPADRGARLPASADTGQRLGSHIV